MTPSNSISLFLGIYTFGNKSPNKPKKISKSAKAIFGKLKSLKALINNACSDTVG
jgi:hypothetical protein